MCTADFISEVNTKTNHELVHNDPQRQQVISIKDPNRPSFAHFIVRKAKQEFSNDDPTSLEAESTLARPTFMHHYNSIQSQSVAGLACNAD